MHSKIKILDEQTANQIAAGEVVDRPAAVVKELLENAIDAQSTRILVHLYDGGITKIQVADNGIGLSREDCKLAFGRHATSKIADAGDLFRIKTLGFRGEALPSIAAVSKVTMVSRPATDLEGTRICLEGGQITSVAAAGCPVGTEVVVEKLFFNTPARKKYLKKTGTEAAHAINTVKRLAVAYPDVCIQLWHNNQKVLSTGGSGNLEDVLIDLYGMEFADNMVPVSFSDGNIQISGFVGRSFQHRSSREMQIFIVNGRYVRSQLLQSALETAYKGLLPSRRYPVAIINIRISPETIDVNVHPTKLEVKFAHPEDIAGKLREAVTASLTTTKHIPVVEAVPKPEPVARIEQVREAVETYLQTQLTTAQQEHPPAFPPVVTGDSVLPFRKQVKEEQKNIAPVEEKPVAVFPDLTAIGQLHDSFILAQGVDGLYIVDQHGAHERLHYEMLQDQVGQETVASQALVIPVTLDLNPVERDLLVGSIVQLRELGIIIEHFGKNTFLIRAVPPGLTGDDAAELIMDLLHSEMDSQLSPMNLKENGLKLVACKQSVRANKKLTLEEQQALLDSLAQLRHPFTCPHGRPIIINFSIAQLRRKFGRD